MFRTCIQLSEKPVKTILFQNQFFIKSNCETTKRWAGHSKWANIKHTKMAKDRDKSLAFSKMRQKIVLAVKENGEDPRFNFKLKTLLEEAKRICMPNEKLKNAIASAKTSTAVKPYWVTYSGPADLLIAFEVTIENTNKAIMTLGHYTRKLNLKLLKYPGDLWQEKGFIISEPLKEIENGYEKAMEDALEIGIEEVLEEEDKTLVFQCVPSHLDAAHKKLAEIGYNIKSTSTELEFQKYVNIGEKEIQVLNNLIEKMQNEIQDIVRTTMNVETESVQ